MKPRVVIFDEPTRGIDVGAKSEIYELMRGLADAGVAILMISSDMEEVIGVSDRIVVMHEGAIGGFLERGRVQRGERDAAGRRPARPAGAEAVPMLKKDLGLFLLIVVVGRVVAIINPRFLSPINLGQHRQSDRPVRPVLDRRGLRHHHRRHRPLGRLDVRPARRRSSSTCS